MKKNNILLYFFLFLMTSQLYAGNGLLGKYYNNNTYTTPAVLTKIDSTINSNWGNGSPDASVNSDNFSVVWTGYIIIPETATYTFYVAYDDFISVSINGTQYYSDGTWTGGDTTYKNFTTNTLAAGTYPIEIRFIEYSGGAYARFAWKNNQSIKKRTIVPSSNLLTPPSLTIANANLTENNSSYSNMNFTVTISEAANASVQYTTSDGTATAGSDYNATSGTLTFTADGNTTKIISVPIKGDTFLENNETFTVNLSNATNAYISTGTATGTIINDDMGYCGTNALSDGFHVVNPFNDINKSIEIFCYNNRDFIALPNKNSSNNFVFNSNTLGSTNYYTEASNNGVPFQAIEINAYTLDVIINPSLRSPQTVGTFQTMGSSFSNINLTATPFAIDWDNTSISNCTQSKLRTAYYGQDVKINSLDYDNQAICNINKMKLKLLDDYRYLVYENNEILQKSCKTMAEAVPTSFLDASTVKGHYWISPFSHSRSYNSTDITSDQRPIVAYCWYQSNVNGTTSSWVWTFSLAMDGKVTNQKSDLVNKYDTCSKFGLYPFVPNNEYTFERVRAFLLDKKAQWINYTGTNNEKFNMFNNGSNYYLDTEYDSVIWPYGSFGVYFPNAGNTPQTWGGTSTKNTGWMSGSPMHNLKSITNDYSRFNDGTKRDYYSWGNYSNTDTLTNTNQYTYADTMGAKGWVSILGSADLNKTDEWFISRTGAGDNFSSTSNYPYYEPNGNYTAGAWLNFLFDSIGRVRHLDDLNNAYSYYDYMCMGEDNYDFYTPFDTTEGPFTVIEHGQTLYNGKTKNAIDIALKTKIVKNSLDYDLILWDNSLTAISRDQNLSAGLFLTEITKGSSSDIVTNLHYFGQINGTSPDLNTSNGYLYLDSSKWPSNSNVINSAKKKVLFQFKYCNDTRLQWTDCWTKSGNSATCKSGCTPNAQGCLCKTAESDIFAVRPDKYTVDVNESTPYKAGKAYNITFHAKDASDVDTQNYNETIPFTSTQLYTLPDCLIGEFDTNVSSMTFVNGIKNIPHMSYSEVDKLNIKVKENSGSEFALVDANDTSDTQRYITPYDQNWSYTPDHFGVSGTITNGGNGFTYVSNDTNMSLILDLNITAQRENNVTTQNYNSGCYAEGTYYTINYNKLTFSPPNAYTKIRYFETNTSTTGLSDINATLQLGTAMTPIPDAIFGTTTKGKATLSFKINFDRNMTIPTNPFLLTLRDINVTDENLTKGSKDLNHSSLFYYGRVYSTDYRGPIPIDTTIRYEVYCKDCNKTDLNITGAQSPTSLNWYQNPLHVTSDGNVTDFDSATVGTKATAISNPKISTINNGFDTTAHLLTNPNAPYTDRIRMTPSSWLLYNPYNAAATTNDFNVEFTRSGNWAGEGNLGRTVDLNTSTRTNRRMEW